MDRIADDGRARAAQQRGRPPRRPPARAPSASSQPANLLGLQRLAGNRAVSALVSSTQVQRYPVPTATQLRNATGYEGGQHWTRSWAVLLTALEGYKQDGSNPQLTEIIRASEAARATFAVPKKQNKVGAATAGRVVAALCALEQDCRIEVERYEVEALLASPRGPLEVEGLGEIVRRMPQRYPNWTDPHGLLAAWRHDVSRRIDAAFRRLWAAKLQAELGSYVLERTFRVAVGGQYEYELPHVAWKAHLGASRRTAFTVLGQALPILARLGVQHKVDTDPDVFDKTNKFITIYPPRNERDWPRLIDELNGVAGAVLVAGELPVGRRGVVGMRHGQITALTKSGLESMGICLRDTRLSVGDLKVVEAVDKTSTHGGPGEAQTEKVAEKHYPVDNTALPNSFLVVIDGVVGFVQPRGKLAPAILYNGAIRPDPRDHPNPYGHTLPEGVTLPP